jgi:3-oxoadipate enol-lactonase
VSAVELAHTVAGGAGGPPVLLAGSLGTHRQMWDDHVQWLSQAWRPIAFDHRGHGDSPVPVGPYTMAELGADVLALMDRLELQRASYVGLSIGGMVGLWLAVNAPQRIERLVLICTAAHAPAQAYRDRAAAVRDAGTTEVVADAVLGRWFTAPWTAEHPELVARFRAMIIDTPAAGYAGCCEAIAGHDVRARLGNVRSPTLVLSGAQDESLPPAFGREIADGVTDARFELLDSAAHIASVERAEKVQDLIREHLGES